MACKQKYHRVPSYKIDCRRDSTGPSRTPWPQEVSPSINMVSGIQPTTTQPSRQSVVGGSCRSNRLREVQPKESGDVRHNQTSRLA